MSDKHYLAKTLKDQDDLREGKSIGWEPDTDYDFIDIEEIRVEEICRYNHQVFKIHK